MENILKFDSKINPEFGCEEYTVKLGRKKIVYGNKHADWASVCWMANPKRTKEEHFAHFLNFYTVIREGGLQSDAKKIPLPEQIILSGLGWQEKLSLEELLGKEPKIMSNPHFEDFQLLRINTPYAAFTMEDYSAKPWNPKTGRLTIATHLRLPDPVSQFVSETSRYNFNKEELQKILSENIYRFD